MKRVRRIKRGIVLMLVALALAGMLPARVEAHLNSTGMGSVYDGLLHFLLSTEDLSPVLALALFAGLRGAAYGRRALFVLPSAWLLGGLAGLSSTITANPILTAISFLLLGGLVAADTQLSLRATTVIAALLGWYTVISTAQVWDRPELGP